MSTAVFPDGFAATIPYELPRQTVGDAYREATAEFDALKAERGYPDDAALVWNLQGSYYIDVDEPDNEATPFIPVEDLAYDEALSDVLSMLEGDDHLQELQDQIRSLFRNPPEEV